MKKTLVNYEVLESIQKNSLTTIEQELIEAQDVLARVLETGPLDFLVFRNSDVVYETIDGNYIHANYEFDSSGMINFTNIQEVEIDEDSEQNQLLKTVSEMVAAIENEDNAKADEYFQTYIEMFGKVNKRMTKNGMNTGRKDKSAVDTMACNMKNAGRGGVHMKESKAYVDYRGEKPRLVKTNRTDPAKSLRAKKAHLAHKSAYKAGQKKRHANGSTVAKEKQHRLAGTPLRKAAADWRGANPRKMREWLNIGNNIFEFLDQMDYMPVLNEAQVQHDESGDVISVSIPNRTLRNESKVVNNKWKTLETDSKMVREAARHLCQNNNFCKSVSEIKKYNNVSDNDRLEASLLDLVAQYPQVLYLTQPELASQVKEALNVVGTSNFSDETCNFMAEGILRVAFQSYPERVEKLYRLAKTEALDTEDQYTEFQSIVSDLYPTLDEARQVEYQVLVDLHDVLVEMLDTLNDQLLRNENLKYINAIEELLEVGRFDVDLVAEASDWVTDLVESNIEGKSWDVSNSVYTTKVGEHPQMAKNASTGYTPSSDFSGNWGSSAPVSDGKSYKSGGAKEMEDNSWSNIKTDLSNPNVPTSIKPKLKGEEGPNDGKGLTDGSDTYPGLSNPYLLKSLKQSSNEEGGKVS